MRYDAKELSYEKVKVFGQNALFTEDRIIRESVPHGFYLYEVRQDDDCQGNPVEVKRWIMVNFLGTLLLKEPIEEVECKGYVWICMDRRKRLGLCELQELYLRRVFK